MFRWPRRSKSEAAATATAPAREGFFSTQSEPGASRFALAQRMQASLSRSIQRELKLDNPVDANGQAVAMDSTIEQAKLLSSSQGFLPIHQVEWYANQGFIGWQMCAIIAQNWLVDKACSMPGRDAVRHGWERSVNDGTEVDPRIFDEMRKLDKKFKVKKNCEEHIRFAGHFGVRHTQFLVDGIDYEQPFNPDGVQPGTYKGMTQIDPYWLAPEISAQDAANPASPHFYEPTWWRVQGKRIHRSHFVISRNMSEPADILKPSYFYGGIPTTQKIFERIYAAERTANEAPLLAMTKRLITLQIDITQAMADKDKFQAKMEEWSALMNNFGVKIIGENEQVSLQDTNLTGLDETIMTQYQLVAAAAEVPATKLLGTSPKGFNATGEYDEKSYNGRLETLQENELSPLLERHDMLVMRSEIAPKFKMKPINVEVQWNPVDSPGAKEQAEINKSKADTDKTYVDCGALDGADVRQRLITDRDSGYNGIDPIVPGGPGDREAEQEAEEAALAAENEPKERDVA